MQAMPCSCHGIYNNKRNNNKKTMHAMPRQEINKPCNTVQCYRPCHAKAATRRPLHKNSCSQAMHNMPCAHAMPSQDKTKNKKKNHAGQANTCHVTQNMSSHEARRSKTHTHDRRSKQSMQAVLHACEYTVPCQAIMQQKHVNSMHATCLGTCRNVTSDQLQSKPTAKPLPGHARNPQQNSR